MFSLLERNVDVNYDACDYDEDDYVQYQDRHRHAYIDEFHHFSPNEYVLKVFDFGDVHGILPISSK